MNKKIVRLKHKEEKYNSIYKIDFFGVESMALRVYPVKCNYSDRIGKDFLELIGVIFIIY